jgi:hypothetical protein
MARSSSEKLFRPGKRDTGEGEAGGRLLKGLLRDPGKPAGHRVLFDRKSPIPAPSASRTVGATYEGSDAGSALSWVSLANAPCPRTKTPARTAMNVEA